MVDDRSNLKQSVIVWVAPCRLCLTIWDMEALPKLLKSIADHHILNTKVANKLVPQPVHCCCRSLY